MPYLIERSLLVPHPLDRVFAFFADARNLQALTPPWLHFSVVSQGDLAMREGLLIDYRIRLRILPMRWQSRITAWQPPHRFIDEQTRGPYRRWVHEHTFTPQDGATLVRDRVEYEVPGGPLAPLIHRLLVRPDLERIFDYRTRVLPSLLSAR